jgi:chaperonin GroES
MMSQNPTAPHGSPVPRAVSTDEQISRGGGIVQVRPLGDRVLVKPIDEPEKKKGGIIIPDTAKEKPQQGEVIAVGKGRLLESGERAALEVKKGDKVLFRKYSGTEIDIENDKYLILGESDILATI